MSAPGFVIIDGHALAYRQYFALPVQAFRTRAGEPTNATYGFTRTPVSYTHLTLPTKRIV